MAEITADDLRQEIENLQQQAQNYANAYQQAVGALQLAAAMLERLEGREALNMDEFAQLIGGKGATAEISEVTNESQS